MSCCISDLGSVILAGKVVILDSDGCSSLRRPAPVKTAIITGVALPVDAGAAAK
jgi:hypothetical protein